MASEMAAQVASESPARTQVLGVTVEQASVEVQSSVVKQATQALDTVDHLGVASEMAAHETQALDSVDHTGVA